MTFIRATCLAIALAGPATMPLAAQESYRITTGDPGGVYYPVAGAICSLVNRAAQTRPPCRTITSDGSVANLEALRTNQARFAIAQNDIATQAHGGRGLFDGAAPFDTLRTVFSLHNETLTILARGDSGITTFDDLRGRRVNLGNVGSGQRATTDAILDAKGWSLEDFELVSELSASDQTAELCAGDLDAGIYIVGHPAGVIAAALAACDLVFVAADDADIAALVDSRDEFDLTEIPAETYPQAPDPVATLGVRASLFTTAATMDDTVDHMVASVMRDLDRLTSAHPSLAALTPEPMVRLTSSVPLHPAARRYFQVTGYLDLQSDAD
ncbi:TAXI family TRAP transporter solute-binding subunit [Maribius pontilimi]|uniref:TAXI family TRAP transporter solute-binding subunit n=1 Tax=Palleronia pontilimi TaxID=1964209 RepID=A0A934IGQ5_9RHOB|nr:TAXI family TRAP transporter solute-binding subunit [Palleronia pontilimi]MBJ3762521.1 TAXI family TRAP transporter solute-binding subunit [Palleronia pontilimi]